MSVRQRAGPLLLSAVLALSAACPQPGSVDPGPSTTSEPTTPALAGPKDKEGPAQPSLRIGVFGDQERAYLPRAASAADDGRRMVLGWANSLGRAPELLQAESLDELLVMVAEGKVDVAAAQLTVTEARKERVTFTRPLRVVDELLVGPASGSPKVETAGDVAPCGIHVIVAPGSSYADTARQRSAACTAAGQKPWQITPASPDDDDVALLHAIAEGRSTAKLTLVDSDQLATVSTYEPRLKKLGVVKAGRQIAWALAPNAKELKAAADAYIIEQQMTDHTRDVFLDDLDGIKQRKVLRVLTRNNAVTYYLHRGQQVGFDYELSKKLAADLGVRLEIVVPDDGDLIRWLKAGRGDVIAAAFTVTEARKAQIAFSTPYLHTNQLLVAKAATAKAASPEAAQIKTLADVAGKKIHVRQGSNYAAHLAKLAPQVGPLDIVFHDRNTETEELVADVAAGKIMLTVADSHIFELERTHHPELVAVLSLTQAPAGKLDARGKPAAGAQDIAFVVRKEATKLRAFLDGWVAKNYRGLEYNVLKKKYFASSRVRARAEERKLAEGQLSPYDDIIKKYAAQYSLDWRLLAAQAYQESQFDPNAQSWVGARGLFQVMPATGKEMGFTKLTDPDEGTHAGVKYLAHLIGQFEPTLPLKQRIRFALASYNAGRGHVIDARRLARQKGLDPDKWFNNVEKTMLLLAKPAYARRARHGYCRGQEPVTYVSNIQTKYDAYARLFPER